MGFKQFRLNGCLSYIFDDPLAHRWVVIDPITDLMDDYRIYLKGPGGRIFSKRKPPLFIKTQTYSDHSSAEEDFKSEWGAQVFSGNCDRIPLGEGDGFVMDVLRTPGVGPDAACYSMRGMVFTGDTLRIPERKDRKRTDPAQHWQSVKKLLRTFPPSSLAFPAHDFNDLLFSTLEAEAKKNPLCLARSLEEFRGEGAKTGEFGDLSRVPGITVEKYFLKLKENSPGYLFIDVREPSEFEESHMPGVRLIPLSEIPFQYAELCQAKRIYFSCLTGRRSGIAAKTLNYLGHPDVVNVTGGFKAWVQAGLPMVSGS